MPSCFRSCTRIINNDSGATAVEYGLLLGLIALGIIAGGQLLGTEIDNFFTNTSTELKNHNTPNTGN